MIINKRIKEKSRTKHSQENQIAHYKRKWLSLNEILSLVKNL